MRKHNPSARQCKETNQRDGRKTQHRRDTQNHHHQSQKRPKTQPCDGDTRTNKPTKNLTNKQTNKKAKQNDYEKPLHPPSPATPLLTRNNVEKRAQKKKKKNRKHKRLWEGMLNLQCDSWWTHTCSGRLSAAWCRCRTSSPRRRCRSSSPQ